jgi:hypothetical protein
MRGCLSLLVGELAGLDRLRILADPLEVRGQLCGEVIDLSLVSQLLGRSANGRVSTEAHETARQKCLAKRGLAGLALFAGTALARY